MGLMVAALRTPTRLGFLHLPMTPERCRGHVLLSLAAHGSQWGISEVAEVARPVAIAILTRRSQHGGSIMGFVPSKCLGSGNARLRFHLQEQVWWLRDIRGQIADENETWITCRNLRARYCAWLTFCIKCACLFAAILMQFLLCREFPVLLAQAAHDMFSIVVNGFGCCEGWRRSERFWKYSRHFIPPPCSCAFQLHDAHRT